MARLRIHETIENESYLKKSIIPNQDFASVNYTVGVGTHYLAASIGVTGDNLCDLIEVDPGVVNSTIYVNTIPVKENLGCEGGEFDQYYGNPCDAANGNKYQKESDYISHINGFSIVRHYNSRNLDDLGLGRGWTARFLKRLILGVKVIHARRGNGSRESFVFDDGAWKEGDNGTLKIYENQDGYSLVLDNGNVEKYDLSGRLVEEDIRGYILSYSYGADGYLESIHSPFGHVMEFTFYGDGHVQTVLTAGSESFNYEYDNFGNLVKVTDQSGHSKAYHYENSIHAHSLTGITDEEGVRYSTFGYNNKGWAELTEHAETINGSAQERYELDYNYFDGREVIVTDPLGNQKELRFVKYLGVKKLQTATNLADGKLLSLGYDPNGNVKSRRDEEGKLTTYTYNNTNQRLNMTEADNTPEEKTTTYTYLSPDIDLVTSITRPSVYAGSDHVTSITYDANLNLDVISESGYLPDGAAITRSTDLDFDTQGRIERIDGPRTDISDITQFTYYSCITGFECGQLQSVINALGHTTTFDTYDAAGRITKTTAPNGLETEYWYDFDGRLKQVTQTPLTGPGRTTLYTYHPTGLLHTVSTPGGSILTYEYDAARDLRSISDNVGNKIEYAYDLSGNRTNESIYDPQGTLTHAYDMAYDVRNRLASITQLGHITQFVQDTLGNLSQTTDANNGVTSNIFDGLNRLTQSTDALNGNTAYQFDVADRVTQVTAPNAVITQYSYDDFGRRTEEVSTDRGLIAYTYDEAGNQLSQLDASGVLINFSYDALNRLATATYPSAPTEDILYLYDNTQVNQNGWGRLTSIQKATGNIAYTYDAWGNITKEDQEIDATSFSTEFEYDSENRLVKLTYPSGRVVTYTRNSLGQISGVNTQEDSSSPTETVASGITYQPFGPVDHIQFANGYDFSFSFDQAYRVQSIQSTLNGNLLHAWQYGYDPVGNILTLENGESAWENQLFNYDPLNRLEGADGDYATKDYQYDANGNRLQLTEGNATTSYGYQAGSNQILSEFDYSASWIYSHNANGQIVSRLLSNGAGQSYIYSAANRLTEVWGHTYIPGKGKKKPGTIEDGFLYSQEYNALGQRVTKTTLDGTIVFIYDHRGKLIAEIDNVTNLSTDYIYLGERPLAISVSDASSSAIYYVHSDHLGTPRYLTDKNGQTVWLAYLEPFGTGAVNDDPDGDGTGVTLNMRFPGQYYDQESELHYNYYRDYDPRTGRYIQSDPIGLQGGLNTYSYGGGNPLSHADPLGLAYSPIGEHGSSLSSVTTIPAVNGYWGAFGCLIGCASYNNKDGSSQVSMQAVVGGGISLCSPSTNDSKDICNAEPDKDCGIYDPNCDNELTPPSVSPPKPGYMISISMNTDGSYCINIGPHMGLPLPSFNLGNAGE